MKRIMVFLVLLLVIPSVSQAEKIESPLKMEELSIKILPEFAYHPLDQEEKHAPLLIGYQGTLVNTLDHSIKGKIEIPLPMKEKNFRIGYVADYSSDLTQKHEIEYEVDQQKGTISWITSEEIKPQQRYKFIIEFYTDSLNVKKEKRTLAYQFTSFADTGLVTISIMGPYKAKDMRLTPPPPQTHGDDKNTFNYYFQDMKAGEKKSLTLTYNRSETIPTMELMKDKSSGNAKSKQNYVVIGSFSGIGLLMAGSLLILLKKRKIRD
jgi:hypothetical protein